MREEINQNIPTNKNVRLNILKKVTKNAACPKMKLKNARGRLLINRTAAAKKAVREKENSARAKVKPFLNIRQTDIVVAK